jgi:hypothetical protein
MTHIEAICLAGTVIVALLLSFFLPRLVVHRRVRTTSPGPGLKEKLELENSLRATSVQGIAAIVAVVVASVGLTQLFNTAHTTKRQLALSASSQDATVFTEAITQLAAAGDKNQPARLGGVYSLLRLATDDPAEYRSRVVDVLSTYVRQTAPRSSKIPIGPLSARDPSIQKALSALGSFTPRSTNAEFSLSLDTPDDDSKALYLGEATFDGGVFTTSDFAFDSLDGSTFRGADLEGSCFLAGSAGTADFRGADLRGASFLEAGNLTSARFDIRTKWDSSTVWPKDLTLSKTGLGPMFPESSSVRKAPCNP